MRQFIQELLVDLLKFIIDPAKMRRLAVHQNHQQQTPAQHVGQLDVVVRWPLW